MTVEAFISWLLGTSVVLGMTGISAFFSLRDRINTFNIELIQRITRVEAVLALLGEKAAKLLHQDDDSYGVDKLLDKYLDRNYELKVEEWEVLMKAMEQLESNVTLPVGARLAAATVSAVCHHKLSIPPIQTRWWKNGKV